MVLRVSKARKTYSCDEMTAKTCPKSVVQTLLSHEIALQYTMRHKIAWLALWCKGFGNSCMLFAVGLRPLVKAYRQIIVLAGERQT